MTKIIYLPKKMNYKARKYLRRGEFLKVKRIEFIRKCEEMGECGPPDPRNGIPEFISQKKKKLEKIISMSPITKEKWMEKPPKDDIMDRVVNHAHQRNPRKKW